MRYIWQSLWLLTILLAGIIENTLSFPVISVGLVLLFCKGKNQWVQWGVLVIIAIVWGVGQSMSIALLFFILAIGVLLNDRLHFLFVNQWSFTLMSAVLASVVGLLRGTSFSLESVVACVVQFFVLWMVVRFLQNRRSISSQFFIAPPTIKRAEKYA